MAIATDSANDLHKIIGTDSTATFEDDPTFVDSNPGAGGSSENVEEQRDTDDTADSDEELEDEDVLDEEDDEDEFDDEDEDDEEEDDADEVAASGLRADGLLGYEDEEEDVEKKRSPQKSVDSGTNRPKHHARATDTDGDDDSGDLDRGVDEDAINSSEDDEIDTDRVAAAAYTQRIAATLQQYAA